MWKGWMVGEIEKDGRIWRVVEEGEEVMVEIVKEGIWRKGGGVRWELWLGGGYVVVIGLKEKVWV